MPLDTTSSVSNAILLDRPVVRISYDADLDVLWALVPGEVIDGHLDDEAEPFADEEDDDGEIVHRAWWLHRGPRGHLIGFGVEGAFAWDVANSDVDGVWSGPTFDAPTLGIRGASVGEIVLAAGKTI